MSLFVVQRTAQGRPGQKSWWDKKIMKIWKVKQAERFQKITIKRQKEDPELQK